MLGFTPEGDRVWEFGDKYTCAITRGKLLSFFKPLTSDGGMCGEDWFIDAARQRAERRIDEYVEFFSGKKRQRIPNLVRKLL